MPRFTRALSVALATAALTLAVACGGGGEQSSSEPVDPQLLVTDPSAALGASADRFDDQVESVEARFSFDMNITGFPFGATGNFAYRAPDSVHMTMDMSGGDDGSFDLGDLGQFEVLVLGDDIYMNTGLTGWTVMSPEDLGQSADSFKKLTEGHAPLDYRALVDDAGGTVENLGDTAVDGKTYSHLRVTAKMGALFDSVMSSLGDSGLDDSLFPIDLDSPVTMDILMDPATLLPYTFEASGDFGSSGQPAQFTMAFTFFDYNGTVDIPEPPDNAKPFQDAFGDALGN